MRVTVNEISGGNQEAKLPLHIQLYMKSKRMRDLTDEMARSDIFRATEISNEVVSLSQEIRNLRNKLSHLQRA